MAKKKPLEPSKKKPSDEPKKEKKSGGKCGWSMTYWDRDNGKQRTAYCTKPRDHGGSHGAGPFF